jgi:hypothetical protein
MEIGSLAWSFRTIRLIKIFHQITLALHPLSYITGSNPIDAIWVLADIEVKASSIYPHAFSIGNHQAIVVDIFYSSIISSSLIPIHLPSMYWLISSNLLVVKIYLECANKGVADYKIKLKLKELIGIRFTQILGSIN